MIDPQRRASWHISVGVGDAPYRVHRRPPNSSQLPGNGGKTIPMLHWPCAAGGAVWLFSRRAVWLSPSFICSRYFCLSSALEWWMGLNNKPRRKEPAHCCSQYWMIILSSSQASVRSTFLQRSRAFATVSISDSSAWLSYCLQTASSPSRSMTVIAHDKQTRPD